MGMERCLGVHTRHQHHLGFRLGGDKGSRTCFEKQKHCRNLSEFCARHPVPCHRTTCLIMLINTCKKMKNMYLSAHSTLTLLYWEFCHPWKKAASVWRKTFRKVCMKSTSTTSRQAAAERKSHQQHTLQKLVFKDSPSVFDVACVLFYYVYVKLKEFCSAKRQEKKSRVNDCWPCLGAFFFRSKLCFMFYHHSSALLLSRTHCLAAPLLGCAIYLWLPPWCIMMKCDTNDEWWFAQVDSPGSFYSWKRH